MRINDTFAATVAAVVPVLWLVAVVEVHQYRRRMFPLEWPIDQQLESALESVRSVSDEALPEVISIARLALEEARFHEPENKKMLYRFESRFLIVALGLLGLEAPSLLWLLGWHDDPVLWGVDLFRRHDPRLSQCTPTALFRHQARGPVHGSTAKPSDAGDREVPCQALQSR